MTGGQSDPDGFKTPIIVTTEVCDSELGSWAFSGAKLPQPMNGLKATNIDGRVLIFGNIFYNTPAYYRNIIIVGGTKYNDDILEYDPGKDAIVPLGQMTQARYFHAISVVQTQDYSNWCNENEVWSHTTRQEPKRTSDSL